MALSNLPSIINQIQTTPNTQKEIENLNKFLKSSQMDGLLRRESLAAVKEALSKLNPADHSLGYLYLLESKAREASGLYAENSFNQIRVFLSVCLPEQVCLAPRKLAEICRLFSGLAVSANSTALAIVPLKRSLSFFDRDLLTPMHIDFLQVCILSKSYRIGSCVFDHPVSEVDPLITGCTARDVLLYCYYGSIVLLGLHRYREALDILHLAITIPASIMNAITVACIKRWILVSIILGYALPTLPQYAPPPVCRAMKSECGAYTEFAKKCQRLSPQDNAAHIFAVDQRLLWEQDGNTGLVALALEVAKRRHTSMSAGLYFSSAMEAFGVEENHLLKMIECGDLNARISQKSQVIFFFGEEAFMTGTDIEELMGQSILLHEKLIDLEFKMSMNRKFLIKTTSAAVKKTTDD